MAPKKKAGKAAPEPPAKKAKVEEEEKKEEPKAAEPEEPKEKEQDEKPDKRAALKEAVAFDVAETTLNVVSTAGGKVLKSLSDGGMQYLIAGARANTGIKAGRYFYEVRIIEVLNPAEGPQGRGRVPQPKNLARVGFSVGGSSLILGDGDKGVAFDVDGFYWADKKRVPATQRWGRDVVVGVLLNLDSKSPNANTVSLFKNGERAGPPQAIPEALQGQPLFPHVSFRNVAVQVNFGPSLMKELPFKCRAVGAAASADCTVTKASAPKDGTYEVLFPVAIPDEGTFDWVDDFLEKNPSYVELSDRMIQEWAVKSGVWKPKNQPWRSSNDKPEFNFGLGPMDDGSVRRAIMTLAGVMPRNYVMMEIKQNLVEGDRKENLKRFSAPHFKKIAKVVMGEPPAAYKSKTQDRMLAEKTEKEMALFRARQLEKERKKQIEKRQKELQEAKEKAEKEAAAAAAAAAGDDAEMKEEAKEEVKEEEKKDEEMKEEKEEEEEAPPTIELTEEEKKMWFRPVDTQQGGMNDVASQVLNHTFTTYEIPSKAEGFDDVKFEWQAEAKAAEYLKAWVAKKKIETRIENLTPGEWFTEQQAAFVKSLQEWQSKAKDPTKEAPAAKPAGEEGEKKEGEEEEKKEEEKKDEVDIMSVEDVCDTGSGEPLFASFTFEDWALLTLRHEFQLLVAAFMKDCGDPERVGVHESHVFFYYSKYYKKQLNPKAYGKDTLTELLNLIDDTVVVDGTTKVLVSKIDGEPQSTHLVKLAEKARRERQHRLDGGDETVRLNFSLLKQILLAPPPAVRPPPPPAVGGGGMPYGKGGGKGGPMGGKGKFQQKGYGKRW